MTRIVRIVGGGLAAALAGQGATRAIAVPVGMRTAGLALLRPADAPHDGGGLRRVFDEPA